MRNDQFIGLPPDAIGFLEKYETPEECCKECKRPFPRELKIIGRYFGIGGTEYPLYRHILVGGGHADEFLQAQPWSSGPRFFLGLKLLDSIFEWPQEDIGKA